MIGIKVEDKVFKVIFGFLLSILFLSSCDKTRVYEGKKDFESTKWFADSVCNFNFKIDDANQSYHILYQVRNSVNYPYYNLFVKYSLKDSTGKEISGDLQELTLMDAKTGEPFGNGMGDIFDNKVYALKNFKFPQNGTYTFSATQYMRKDPLDEILAFGIRVEKANNP
jgi:gliding motility-associated lipoprotein GldH